MEQQTGKIPIPASRRWKEFRIKIIPGLIFICVSLVVYNLWDQRVTSANMTGKVIGVQAQLRSPHAGYLTPLQTARFQQVTAGDAIAEVVTTDPRIIEAQLAVVLAEVEMIRHGIGPMDSHQRNRLDLESLQMDLMKQRIELASANISSRRAERDYNRISRLHDEGLASEEEYERVKSEYDILRMETEELAGLLDTMNRRIEQFDNASSQPVNAAIRLQEERLRLIEAEMMPVTLRAPIDGMISRVYRSGEQVQDGDSILTIQSSSPDYIVGYLPHPVRMEPEIGMTVIVRSQSNNRVEFETSILNIGVQVEDMSEVQNLQSQMVRTGLAVKIGLDDQGLLRPGEIVDLTLRPH